MILPKFKISISIKVFSIEQVILKKLVMAHFMTLFSTILWKNYYFSKQISKIHTNVCYNTEFQHLNLSASKVRPFKYNISFKNERFYVTILNRLLSKPLRKNYHFLIQLSKIYFGGTNLLKWEIWNKLLFKWRAFRYNIKFE